MKSHSQRKVKKSRSPQSIVAKPVRSPGTLTGPIPPIPQPEKKAAPPPVPLDKAEALQRLAEAIGKVTDANKTITIWLDILQEWHARLGSEWNRDKVDDTMSPRGSEYIV
jgi:hypothetical protein